MMARQSVRFKLTGGVRPVSLVCAIWLVLAALVPGSARAADPNAIMGGGPQVSPPAPAEGSSALVRLAGTYTAEGRNADGSRYTGSVAIRIEGARARFRWDIAGQVYTGTGLLAGNVLTVDWGQADPVIYIVNDDGTLSGTWDRGRASERLVPRR